MPLPRRGDRPVAEPPGVLVNRVYMKGHIRTMTTAKKRLTHGPVLLCFLAILGLCYTSVLLTPYGFTDDYAILSERLQGQTWVMKQTMAAGRPMYAVLLSATFSSIHAIGDLRYIRCAGVVGIAVLAWRIYRTLKLAGWRQEQAFLLSLIIVMMPAFQVYAAWATTAFYLGAALVASVAFTLAERACTASRAPEQWRLAAGASFLILVALTIHQSAAMFFWVFAAIVMFKPHTTPSDVVRRLVGYCCIVGVGLILGFGVYKLGMAFYGAPVPDIRAHLTLHVGEKALWFVQSPLMDALNFTKLSPTPWLALPAAIVIGAGFVHYLRGTAKERLAQVLMAGVLLPLAYLPNLVIAENWSSYRTQAALTSVVVVYASYALWGYIQRFPRWATTAVLTAVLSLAALATSLCASYNARVYFAEPQLQELQVIRRQLAQQPLSDISNVYLIGSTGQDTLAPLVRYDEFGLPSSVALWSLKSSVYCVLAEMHLEAFYSFPTQVVPPHSLIQPPPGALVVDMRRMASDSTADQGIRP